MSAVKSRISIAAPVAAALLAAAVSHAAAATTENIRVASYNVEADVSGVTTTNSSTAAVIEGIGKQTITSTVGPVDILGLEETTSNTTTIAPLVTTLNTYYASAGTAVYAQSTLQGTESGGDPSTGNGPNGIIYNTKTLTLVASTGVGTPTGSTNGEYRQVMRYEFIPAGGTTANAFYVYVAHMKSSSSGTTADDQKYRNEEATIIAANEALLPTSSSILVMGDFNLDGTNEAAYSTLLSSRLTDPVNPTGEKATTFSSTSIYKNYLSDSSTSLNYRDDIEFMTNNVYNDTGTLKYLANSYEVFGNTNGTVTATNGVSTTTFGNGSDHLPVVAEYALTIAAVPEPATLGIVALGVAGLFACRRK